MYTLKDQYFVIMQDCLFFIKCFFALIEKKAGKMDSFTFHQVTEMLVQEFMIDCIEMLKIQLTLIIYWCVFTIYEIIIQR